MGKNQKEGGEGENDERKMGDPTSCIVECFRSWKLALSCCPLSTSTWQWTPTNLVVSLPFAFNCLVFVTSFIIRSATCLVNLSPSYHYLTRSICISLSLSLNVGSACECHCTNGWSTTTFIQKKLWRMLWTFFPFHIFFVQILGFGRLDFNFHLLRHSTLQLREVKFLLLLYIVVPHSFYSSPSRSSSSSS